MRERNPVLRLASRLARGEAIDWNREERRARTEEERAGILQLKVVAAMSLVSRALMSGAPDREVSASISQAKSLAGPSDEASRTGLPPPPPLPPGSRWGMLEVHERIGGGAFGEVYRARDTRLDREVALKILGRDVSDPRAEVIREARLLARVRHPNVVMVHGADRIDGRVGIWTEFLQGRTLHQELRERGTIDSREAAAIGIELCRALSAVHAAGIVHQDVKLTNIMRVEDGRTVLMDFGLGREGEGGAFRRAGTPLFMAPEVLEGGVSDARSDVYSLGVVLFALVTGSLPVLAVTLDELRSKHARGEIHEAKHLRPDLPPAFAQFLQRALAPDPGDRYQTAGDAERDLLAFLGVHGREPEPEGRPPARSTTPHRLPAEVDSFVGRETEMEDLSAKLSAGARLVTLLGTGGIGKTRLAVRYGWRSLPDWPGGVWFCDLTEAKTKDGISAAVAKGLGVPLGSGDAVAQLGHAIAGRGPCLLILDNFEQVVESAGGTVAPWLRRAGEARMVVTSRERLKLPGEEVHPVGALPIERGVELFVERARRYRPVEPDGTEGESVREIVRLLEGIPLAIELSAARLSVMTPAQMVDRIAERFRILAGTGGGRHGTLRAAIDGSWELLQPWEKAAFAQCAVFEGGFDLEAAEAVLDLGPWPVAPWVVDVIQSLVDRSLLRSWVPERESPGARRAMRFGMFVSLQEYAREELEATGEIPALGSGIEAARMAERRHGHWFGRFGREEAIDGLDRKGGVERRRALEPDVDNMVAACRRMVAQGDGEMAIGCYRAAWAVLELKGPLAVAVELATQVLETSLDPERRSLMLNLLGLARQRSGQLKEARVHYEDALAIDRERGDRKSEGRTLAYLASIPLNEGRIEEASALQKTALAIHREVGDRRSEGITLGNLGLGLHEQGRLEEASSVLEASLAIHRENGSRRSEGIVLGNLGDLRREQGRVDEALEHLQAAIVIHREVGNRRFEGIALGNLGTLCQKLGRLDEARGHFQAALEIHRQVGSRFFEGQALDNLAFLSFVQGRLDEARAAFREALTILGEVGHRRDEGVVLGHLGKLLLEEGRFQEARESLSRGEALLRLPDYGTVTQIELGKLLLSRAELERRTGAPDAARSTMNEVEAIAARAEARPDSELGRMLESARRALTGPSPG